MGPSLACSSYSTGGGHKSCVWPCFGQLSLPLSHLMNLISHTHGAAQPPDSFQLRELLILSQLLPSPPGTPKLLPPSFFPL